MSNQDVHESIRKLDESFGQFTSSTNKDPEPAVNDKSEDDKKHPYSEDLKLDGNHPGNNDAPEQAVSNEVTPEQRSFSDQVVAQDRMKRAAELMKELDDSEKGFQEKLKEELAPVEKELKEDAMDLHEKIAEDFAPAKKDLEESPIVEKAEAFKKSFQEDPLKAMAEIAGVILMIAGLIAAIRAIFHHR